jgi:MerR family transcriptional regulator, light-induced transcriptional regulator
MAKPATRMKSIVLKSYRESFSQRLARSPLHNAHDPCVALGPPPPPIAGPQATCSQALRAELRATIEEMVIPQLLIGQLVPQAPAQEQRGRVLPTSEEVDLLARIAVEHDLERAVEIALGVLAAGLSLETVLLHWIAPAARRLGTDWEEDLRSFADVTVGLGTLQELVHLLAPRQEVNESLAAHSSEGRGSALLVSGRAEQHTLGLYIFAELLRHSHWTVVLEPEMSHSAVLQAVHSQPLQLLGFTVSSSERLNSLLELIKAIKRASQNPALHVLVGGPADLTDEAHRAGVHFHHDARAAIDWLDSKKQRR